MIKMMKHKCKYFKLIDDWLYVPVDEDNKIIGY